MRRVALVRPASSRFGLYKWYWLLGSREPHLGLLYVASYLEARGCEVVLLDGERLRERELLRRLCAFAPDIVGITANTFTFWNAARLTRQCRRHLPNALFLMGGAHVSALAEDTLRRVPELDACVVGEGEEAAWEVASGKAIAEIGGLVWRTEDGDIRCNPPRAVPSVLDNYPLKWDLVGGFPDGYGPTLQSARGTNPISLVASRGCPFQCTFCAGPVVLGKRRRAHTPKRVVEMMTECNERFGTTHFYFHDDHFTVDKPWLTEFCERSRAAIAPLEWSCASRVEPLTSDVLALMRRGGCYQIGVGGESGSTNVLNLLNKRTDTTKLTEGIKRIQRAGIEVKLYVIIGTPGETAADLKATRRFVRSLRVNHVQVLYFTPLPGTSSWGEHSTEPELWTKMNLLNRMPCSDVATWRLRVTELGIYVQTYGLRRLQRTV